jgi:hypothetical protein
MSASAHEQPDAGRRRTELLQELAETINASLDVDAVLRRVRASSAAATSRELPCATRHRRRSLSARLPAFGLRGPRADGLRWAGGWSARC